MFLPLQFLQNRLEKERCQLFSKYLIESQFFMKPPLVLVFLFVEDAIILSTNYLRLVSSYFLPLPGSVLDPWLLEPDPSLLLQLQEQFWMFCRC